MAKIEIKKGKSREVEIYDTYVLKKSLNTDLNEEDLAYYVIMGNYGIFENIKEYFFWKTIENIKIFKDIFTKVIALDYDTMILKAEKLLPIDEEKFYTKIFSKYIKLSRYSLINQRILDNHTVDNYLNYGVDIKGNIKLLDYGIITGYIFELYNINLEDVKNYNNFNKNIEVIKNDIENNNLVKMKNLYSLLPLAITLKYYNNPFKFYYYIYKYKILDLKTMLNMFLDKR